MNVQVVEQHIANYQGTEVVCVRHGGSEGDGQCPCGDLLVLVTGAGHLPTRQCQLGRAAHMLLPLQSGLYLK